MKIQPILTPDNYVDFVLPFINAAKTSFWMQTQYIHPSDKDGDEKLAALIEAVAQKVKDGLDVRIIMSEFERWISSNCCKVPASIWPMCAFRRMSITRA
jgi:phosphatidylserine/phosphatidylglycerophosphate/cardiolipin synthase-like enzyme